MRLFLFALTFQKLCCSALRRVEYMIFKAEVRRSSCFTSVTIPICTFSSTFRAIVINGRSPSGIDSREAAMKSRISSMVLNESFS